MTTKTDKPDTAASDDAQTPHVVRRIRLAREIAADRIRIDKRGRKLKPLAWGTIGTKHGLSARQCERIFKDLQAWDEETSDPLAIVQSSIDLRAATLEKLSQLGENGDNSNARVGALKAMVDVDRERLELLQATGKLPRNMARYRAEADLATIVREMLDVLEREKVARETLEKLKVVAERHLSAPIGDLTKQPTNITPLRPKAATP